MKDFAILTFSIFLLCFQSCQTSLTDYAAGWSKDIKQKISEDANEKPTRFDSSGNELTLYKDNKKLKSFIFKPSVDNDGKIVFRDTAVSIYYSADQNFELVRELCPVDDRSFEGIRYKGQHVGLAEFRYCNGKLKSVGYRFNGDIGVWKQYDTSGIVIKETDKGHLDRLEHLKEIKYFR